MIQERTSVRFGQTRTNERERKWYCRKGDAETGASLRAGKVSAPHTNGRDVCPSVPRLSQNAPIGRARAPREPQGHGFALALTRHCGRRGAPTLPRYAVPNFATIPRNYNEQATNRLPMSILAKSARAGIMSHVQTEPRALALGCLRLT